MDEIEIPQYFICPISLQIMKDPVTTVSGITYDRESIEHWLSTAKDTTCPVTKQPLPGDSDLTPNHTLRRLIQSWCVLNASNGVDRIPTPKSPIHRSDIIKLIRNLNIPEFHTQALKKMKDIAEESEKSRACMVEAGAMKAMIFLIIRCFKEGKSDSLEESLKILHLIWTPTGDAKEMEMVKENVDLIESILWVLSLDMEEKENHVRVKIDSLLVLKKVVEVLSSTFLEQLKLNFFDVIMTVVRENISLQATKAALHILIEVCPWGINRLKIVESGAVFELIELQLNNPEKSVTEVIFCLLAQLCAYADGRDQFLKHAGSIAMVAKRILRVSLAVDDKAIHILSLVARFSGTNEVVMEMLRVGAVLKLCMVLQADSETYLKSKVREVLRLHSNVWNDSPCISVYLLTKYPR